MTWRARDHQPERTYVDAVCACCKVKTKVPAPIVPGKPTYCRDCWPLFAPKREGFR